MIIGLIPLGFQFLAPLAQLAEHRTLNPQVLGSSPRGRTTYIKPRHSDSHLMHQIVEAFLTGRSLTDSSKDSRAG